MFPTFVNSLTTWFNKTELLQVAHCHSGFNYDYTELPPGLLLIKKNFLKTIVPSQIERVFLKHPYHLDHLVKTIFSFSSYVTETPLKALIESGIFTLLSAVDREQIYNQIQAFLTNQNNWNDSTWHNLLINQPESGFQTIFTSLQFASKWTCAKFLADCSYLIPYSKVSAKGWQNWSGMSDEENSFDSWWQILLSDSQSKAAAFKQDRLLDCFFNPETSVLENPLCIDQGSCEICPLKENCHYFKNTIDIADNYDRRNQIKTGDVKHIPTYELLELLAGESWFETDFQKKVSSEFPQISHNLFQETASAAEENMLCKTIAVKELIERTHEPESPLIRTCFSNAREIYNHFKKELRKDNQESFYAVTLDNKHRIISKRLITLGTLNQSLVHPREVFATAIQLRAAAIILVHNHPSGDPTPSNQDIAITQRLQDVGDIVGIKVLDHIIIGSSTFFSFVDENLLVS